MPGLMDALNDFGRGLAYNSDDAKQARADERELGNYEKKLKLANDVSMQLEERKLQLSKQYPEISKTVNTPFGVTLGVYPDGTTKELYKDEEFRQAAILNKQAPAVRAENQGLLVPSQIGLNDARADAAAVNAGANKTRAEKTGEAKPAKALTARDLASKRAAALKEVMDTMPGNTPGRRKRAFDALGTEGQEAAIQEKLRLQAAGAPVELNAPADADDPFADF